MLGQQANENAASAVQKKIAEQEELKKVTVSDAKKEVESKSVDEVETV